MDSKNFKIAELLLGKMLKTLTPVEEKRLSEWVEASERNRSLYERFVSGESWRNRLAMAEETDTQRMILDVWREIRRKERERTWRVVWSVAASVLILIGVGGFLVKKGRDGQKRYIEYSEKTEFQKKRGVVLELPSGKQLDLMIEDSLALRQMKLLGVVNGKGMLTYLDSVGIENETSMHTLKVPRGAEYMLTLSDGTHVWLNADSRMRYPSRFVEGNREVYLEGEAYFEVARDSCRPFVVKTLGAEVRVLGTAFNLQAYPEERQRTTLVEGRVLVSSAKSKVVLNPSEQAEKEGDRLSIRKVNVNEYTAWLKNSFVFVNTPLEDVLNNLERWYDVDVFVASPSLRELRFTASFSRYEHLDKILETLSLTTHIAFKLKGRLLIVQEE